jgi:hypothetical protein
VLISAGWYEPCKYFAGHIVQYKNSHELQLDAALTGAATNS